MLWLCGSFGEKTSVKWKKNLKTDNPFNSSLTSDVRWTVAFIDLLWIFACDNSNNLCYITYGSDTSLVIVKTDPHDTTEFSCWAPDRTPVRSYPNYEVVLVRRIMFGDGGVYVTLPFLYNAKGAVRFGIFTFAMVVIGFTSLYLYEIRTSAPAYQYFFSNRRVVAPNISIDSTLKFGARPNVQTSTSWNAPIIWEGMFDSKLYDEEHKKHKSSVALTVFAVGKYLDAYLNTFLVSAEKHFMLGLPVMYYIFTDSPQHVPKIKLGPQRNLKVIPVEKYSRWQDISMMRMQFISELIDTEISHQHPYIYCFDVDQVFKGRFGSEALGESVALLHAWFYKTPKNMFTYDRNPKSKAYMETGDFYYHAAIFGGSWQNVKALVDGCYLGIVEDKVNGVEALWHDESHLNKFFWLHKPTRLLSPEYCWDKHIAETVDIKVERLIWAEKHYDTLRT